eukprot:754040-Hanusia_phi.AAC.4
MALLSAGPPGRGPPGTTASPGDRPGGATVPRGRTSRGPPHRRRWHYDHVTTVRRSALPGRAAGRRRAAGSESGLTDPACAEPRSWHRARRGAVRPGALSLRRVLPGWQSGPVESEVPRAARRPAAWHGNRREPGSAGPRRDGDCEPPGAFGLDDRITPAGARRYRDRTPVPYPRRRTGVPYRTLRASAQRLPDGPGTGCAAARAAAPAAQPV